MSGFTRRDFLTWAAATGLLGLAGCATKKGKQFKSNPNAKVVVLGGGFAGATAAKYLKMLDPALKVTLIERNKFYVACPGSNQVIAGMKEFADEKKPQKAASLRHGYDVLARNYGIESVFAEATGIDTHGKTVLLDDGSRVPYDRLIVSPGIDFRWDAIQGYSEATSETIPHAWKAGPQTIMLRRQLRAMKNGGVVVITVPPNPYRCPPGPYERASLMAHYLSQHKPRSKILIVDGKTQFTKQALFQQGWREIYPGMIEWISSEKEGRLERIDTGRRLAAHTEFNTYRADVLNVIPPQMAGKLAQSARLADATGWCPVNPLSFESTLVPGIHVIGDACDAAPMPKSAFAANSQAKVCAAAVIDLLSGNEPERASLINHCYSFLAPDYAISITGVYGYSSAEKRLTALSTGETPPNGDRHKEAEYARGWHSLIMQEVFS
jgi:sulfide dehydrogenase [flavocytochrome c] flavoprotein subunit